MIKKRVLIFVGSFGAGRKNGSASGPAIVAYNLSNALYNYSNKIFSIIISRQEIPKGYEVPRVVQFNKLSHYNKNFLNSFNTIHVLSDKQFALDISNMGYIPIIGTNVVFDVGDPKSLTNKEYLLKKPIVEQEKLICEKRWKKILVPCEQFKERYSTRFNVKYNDITVFPCGININKFKPFDNNLTNKNIMWIGPGVNKGEDIIHKIIDEIPEYNWILKATNKQQPYCYKEHINDLRKTLLYLSLSKYESQGLATMEAMACGIPVVCSEFVKGEPLFKDHVMMVKRNPVHIVRMIRKILNNLSFQKKMSISGYNFIKNNYSLQMMCKNYEDILEV